MENLPKKLMILRHYRQLSPQEVASAISMTETDYLKLEHGEEEPRASHIVALSDYYKVTCDLLLKSDLKTVVFPLRLKELRVKKGVSIEDACLGTGIGKSLFRHYEAGSRIPKIDILITLATYYNVSIDYLVGLDIENLDIEKERK